MEELGENITNKAVPLTLKLKSKFIFNLAREGNPCLRLYLEMLGYGIE